MTEKYTGEKLYRQRYHGVNRDPLAKPFGQSDPPVCVPMEVMLWDELADAKADRDRLQASVEALTTVMLNHFRGDLGNEK